MKTVVIWAIKLGALIILGPCCFALVLYNALPTRQRKLSELRDSICRLLASNGEVSSDKLHKLAVHELRVRWSYLTFMLVVAGLIANNEVEVRYIGETMHHSDLGDITVNRSYLSLRRNKGSRRRRKGFSTLDALRGMFSGNGLGPATVPA